MNKTQLCPFKTLAFMAVVAILAAGCATGVRTGVFPEANRIDSELQKGISKKTDVQRVLGMPKGTGGALLPTDPSQKEIWVYDDIAVTSMGMDANNVLRMDVRQQILLIFFDKGVYDGHMWYSNAGKGEIP